MNTIHYETERITREMLIENTIGIGVTIKSVVVDKGHKNGPEIHEISDTGIITVYNERTRKLVTKLIARPGQLKRYFDSVPTDLMELAKEHQTLGYNLV